MASIMFESAVTGEALWGSAEQFPNIPPFDEETLKLLGNSRCLPSSSLDDNDASVVDEFTTKQSSLANERNASKNLALLDDEDLRRLSEEELACLLAELEELEGPQAQQEAVDTLIGHNAIMLAKPLDEVHPSANLGAAALGAIAAFCLVALIVLVRPTSDSNQLVAYRDCSDVLQQLEAVQAERDTLQVELAALRMAQRPSPNGERLESCMLAAGGCDGDAAGASQVFTSPTSLTARSATAGSAYRIGHQLHIAQSGSRLADNQFGAFDRPHLPAFDVDRRLDRPTPSAVACEPSELSAEAVLLHGQVQALVRENERLMNQEPVQLREAYQRQAIENSLLRAKSSECAATLEQAEARLAPLSHPPD